MDKETKNSIIFVVVGIIIILAIILPIVINRNQENKKLKESFSRIGQAATDYIEDTKNANSYINDFSYNYTTGEVDYHPTITLEMYNRIKCHFNIRKRGWYFRQRWRGRLYYRVWGYFSLERILDTFYNGQKNK